MKSKKAAAIMLCAVLGTSMITGVSVSAKDKDELVLYTWDGMFPQEVLDDFEKKQGPRWYIPTLIPMRPCLRSFPRQRAAITMW